MKLLGIIFLSFAIFGLSFYLSLWFMMIQWIEADTGFLISIFIASIFFIKQLTKLTNEKEKEELNENE